MVMKNDWQVRSLSVVLALQLYSLDLLDLLVVLLNLYSFLTKS